MELIIFYIGDWVCSLSLCLSLTDHLFWGKPVVSSREHHIERATQQGPRPLANSYVSKLSWKQVRQTQSGLQMIEALAHVLTGTSLGILSQNHAASSLNS